MIREVIRNSITTTLQPPEHYLLGKNELSDVPPPCFIIGAPRSGTTLLYEALTIRFKFSYFSNIAERFYNTPAASTYFGNYFLAKRKSGSFASNYGQVDGWGAPSEGGRIWNRWVPQSFYLSADHVTSLPTGKIRNTVASISKSIDAPFLNKNVMHSVHIELLNEIFPNCIFLEVRRDPVANIRSIIRARDKKGGPRENRNWWSVKPEVWQQYENSSVEEQACVQVCSLIGDISKQINKISPERLQIVHYEDFCEQPGKIMSRIKKMFEKQLKIELQDNAEIPQKFFVSPSRPLSSQIESNILDWMATYCS